MEEKYYEAQTFENLKFHGETFEGYKLVDCSFIGCSFEDCRLVRSLVSGCTFDKCAVTNLKAEGYAQIQYAEFANCRLVGINWQQLLPSGRFGEPIRKLQGCSLKYNTFAEMDFKKFDFSDNEVSASIFAQCQLAESKFRQCRLEKTEFFQCDLQNADFRDASGYQVDIMSCKVRGARFSFPEAMNLLGGLGIKID